MNRTDNQHAACFHTFRQGMNRLPLISRESNRMAGMNQIKLFVVIQRQRFHVRMNEADINISAFCETPCELQLLRRNINGCTLRAMLCEINRILCAAASNLQAIKPLQRFRQQFQRGISRNQRPVMKIIRRNHRLRLIGIRDFIPILLVIHVNDV